MRRALRVTLVAAGTFAFFYEVAHNPIAGFFAVFGAVVMLVYVEFVGPKRQRYEQHVSLILMTLVFVVLGTLCSQVLWIAVASTIRVEFLRADDGRREFVVCGHVERTVDQLSASGGL